MRICPAARNWAQSSSGSSPQHADDFKDGLAGDETDGATGS